MGLDELVVAHSQNSRSKSREAQAGFALVSLLALLPLVLTVTFALYVILTGVRRKAWAQSQCVWRATITQGELSKSLARLLSLNPRAARLRALRANADIKLRVALASGAAPAIAVAKAERLAVILAQSIHAGKQRAILREAEITRRRAEPALAESTRVWREGPVRVQPFFPLALAVVPLPASSLTPDYRPAPAFTHRQQLRMRFDVRLSPTGTPRVVQRTECALSLEPDSVHKERKWRLRVLGTKASAAWNSW